MRSRSNASASDPSLAPHWLHCQNCLHMMDRCTGMGTCAAAAGTLQNLAREAASRQLIRQQRAVPHLAALLSAPDLQVRLQNIHI